MTLLIRRVDTNSLCEAAPNCNLPAAINILTDDSDIWICKLHAAWLSNLLKDSLAQKSLTKSESPSEVLDWDLLDRLKNKDSNIQIAALEALVHMRPNNMSPITTILFDILQESNNPLVKWNAQFALGKLGGYNLNMLLQGLSRQDHCIRQGVCYALGVIQPNKITINALLGCLKDTAEDVRMEAACALGKLCANHKEKIQQRALIIQNLAVLLQDESESVRWMAAEALSTVSPTS